MRELFTTVMIPTNCWFARAAVTLFDAGGQTANYYVATNGNDLNAGTSTNAPFYTLNKAASVANAGNLIYVRGGTFIYSN